LNALENLVEGLGQALTPQNLMWVLIGVTLGTVVGILPGLGNPAAVLAVLLPLTLKLPPTTGLIMMAGLSVSRNGCAAKGTSEAYCRAIARLNRCSGVIRWSWLSSPMSS
jgi:TctA family transporter